MAQMMPVWDDRPPAPDAHHVTVVLVGGCSVHSDALMVALRADGFETRRYPVEDALPPGAIAVVDPDVELATISHLADAKIGVIAMVTSTDPGEIRMLLDAGATCIFPSDGRLVDLSALIIDMVRDRPPVGSPADAELLAALDDRRVATRTKAARFGLLTRREAAVLDLLMAGQSAERIAEQRFVSIATVRSHIQAILRKLEVNSQLAAVALAHEVRWVEAATA